MKKIIIAAVITTAAISACNSGNKDKPSENSRPDKSSVKQETIDPETTTSQTVAAVIPIKDIIEGYLQLKNALAKDDTKAAAAAGKAIVGELGKVEVAGLSGEQQKNYPDISADMKENATHISESSGKIDHQREHFEMLGKDMADLMTLYGNGGITLYQDFCPMANEGKGALWFSEVKEIRNPYMGKSMISCGEIKEKIK